MSEATHCRTECALRQLDIQTCAQDEYDCRLMDAERA